MAESKAHEAVTPVDDGHPPSPGADQSNSFSKVIQNAKAATQKERNMSLLQGIRLYPKAVAWSILISTCIAMEGYDISLVNNFYGFPQFKQKYGEQLPNGNYEVTAPVGGSPLVLYLIWTREGRERERKSTIFGNDTNEHLL